MISHYKCYFNCDSVNVIFMIAAEWKNLFVESTHFYMRTTQIIAFSHEYFENILFVAVSP